MLWGQVWKNTLYASCVNAQTSDERRIKWIRQENKCSWGWTQPRRGFKIPPQIFSCLAISLLLPHKWFVPTNNFASVASGSFNWPPAAASGQWWPPWPHPAPITADVVIICYCTPAIYHTQLTNLNTNHYCRVLWTLEWPQTKAIQPPNQIVVGLESW